MKRILRTVTALIITAVIVFSFAGCKSLDTKKQNQAFWNNKKHTEILFDGKIYKMLKSCEYFAPDTYPANGTYVTDKDVPVLIARDFGESYFITENKEIISTAYSLHYARSDVFDKYETLIKNYKLDRLSTQITVYTKTSAYDKTVFFSEKETDLLNTAFETAKEDDMIEDDYAEGCMDIYETDETGLFSCFKVDFVYYKASKRIQFFSENDYYTVLPEYTKDLIPIIEKYSENKNDVVYEG